ncbi:hypothetical protein [Spirosoma gilvum]
MKKRITRIILKTDRIVALSGVQTQQLLGGKAPVSYRSCTTDPGTISQFVKCG